MWMQRCLQLAQLGKGAVAPNPMVGAVLVHGDRVLAEGYHARYGDLHAEAACLNAVREADRHLIRDSTLYVNLEPCAHHGKQPPCAARLVREEVGRVVVCNNDPFEAVSGKGYQLLRLAGIPVEKGVLESEGRWLNRRFFAFWEQQRPYIILKWAQTADGFIAPSDKTRTMISGPLAQQLVHRWRTEEAAILVGKATALADDPQLTARLWEGPQPLRLVLDSHLALPETLNMFNGAAETWQVNTKEESQLDTHRRVRIPTGDDALTTLVQRLFEAGKQSLIVEGGAAVLRSFIGCGLWDEMRVFHSPHCFGQGIAAPQVLGARKVLDSHLGDDSLSVYLPRTAPLAFPAGAFL
jgi:diaminohydroxyphosphoribosylaminopyrimidine deaminase/5-amino-6-(5-phosphoribosylamino)uracil reductase